jgi:thioredoxin reductase (NADPH)
MFEKNTFEYDVVIIGAGPAGMTAAIYTQRANLKTVMLEKGAPGGKMMSTWEVENYTGLGQVTGFDISEKMFNHTQELGVEYKYGDVVNIVDQGKYKEVHTASGDIYKAKAVLIGSGTVPRSTKADGEARLTGKGVSWCAVCDGAFFKDKEIVVVGGGNSAIEEAVYLTKMVKKITVVNFLEGLQADAKAIDQLNETNKAEYYTGHEVVSFNGEDVLTSVTVKNRKTEETFDIPCEGAFVFIGQLPETPFVKELGITNKWGYIEVDQHMATKVPGIFGMGDVIDKDLRQIVTAASDGSIAAVAASKYIETLGKD